MKKLSITLIGLLTTVGLSMGSAQAATYHKKPMVKHKHHVVMKKHQKKMHKPMMKHTSTARHHMPMRAHSEMNMDIPADLKISENRGTN